MFLAFKERRKEHNHIFIKEKQTMTYKSTIKVLKYLIMCAIFINVSFIQNLMASGCMIPGCQQTSNGNCSCPPGISPTPKITADDILNYAKTGSHPDWTVIRKSETLKAPASAAEIIVGEVENLGNGSYTVHYTVRGIPQKATIVPKKAPQPAAPVTK